jgi:hypothetical protein
MRFTLGLLTSCERAFFVRTRARVLNRNARALRLVLVIDSAFRTAGACKLVRQYQDGHSELLRIKLLLHP